MILILNLSFIWLFFDNHLIHHASSSLKFNGWYSERVLWYFGRAVKFLDSRFIRRTNSKQVIMNPKHKQRTSAPTRTSSSVLRCCFSFISMSWRFCSPTELGFVMFTFFGMLLRNMRPLWTVYSTPFPAKKLNVAFSWEYFLTHYLEPVAPKWRSWNCWVGLES